MNSRWRPAATCRLDRGRLPRRSRPQAARRDRSRVRCHGRDRCLLDIRVERHEEGAQYHVARTDGGEPWEVSIKVSSRTTANDRAGSSHGGGPSGVVTVGGQRKKDLLAEVKTCTGRMNRGCPRLSRDDRFACGSKVYRSPTRPKLRGRSLRPAESWKAPARSRRSNAGKCEVGPKVYIQRNTIVGTDAQTDKRQISFRNPSDHGGVNQSRLSWDHR